MRLAAELGGKIGLVGAAHARAGRIAALGHEAVDHPVEDDIVVKAFLDQLADPLDMPGREIGAKPDDDVAAAVEAQNEDVLVVGHARISFCEAA